MSYPYKPVIAILERSGERMLRCATHVLAEGCNAGCLHIDTSLQSVVDADDNDVVVCSGVNVLGTINLVASNTPSYIGGGVVSDWAFKFLVRK